MVYISIKSFDESSNTQLFKFKALLTGRTKSRDLRLTGITPGSTTERMSLIISSLSFGAPYDQLMPIQTSPGADTLSPLFPGLLFVLFAFFQTFSFNRLCYCLINIFFNLSIFDSINSIRNSRKTNVWVYLNQSREKCFLIVSNLHIANDM